MVCVVPFLLGIVLDKSVLEERRRPRARNLLSRASNLLSRARNLLSRARNLLSRARNLLSRARNLLSRGLSERLGLHDFCTLNGSRLLHSEWLKPGPKSGRDCLICSKLARQCQDSEHRSTHTVEHAGFVAPRFQGVT